VNDCKETLIGPFTVSEQLMLLLVSVQPVARVNTWSESSTTDPAGTVKLHGGGAVPMVLVHLWPCACSDVTVYAVSPERVIVSVKVGIVVVDDDDDDDDEDDDEDDEDDDDDDDEDDDVVVVGTVVGIDVVGTVVVVETDVFVLIEVVVVLVLP
jgi:hypothetical protein